MKNKILICLIILFTTTGLFAQDVEINPWGYGLETSFSI